MSHWHAACTIAWRCTCLRLSLQLHTRLHKLEQERRQQSAKKMDVYAQQVALLQLKDESTDKPRLAQKLAELEVRQRSAQVCLRLNVHALITRRPYA